MERVSFS